MRAPSRAAWILGCGITCLPLLTHGASFTVEPEPSSWDEIENKIDEIPGFLANGDFCGGWNKEKEIGEGLGAPNLISKVEGLPGREGVPLDALESGMALKDDINLMYYPDSARGFTTACEPGQPGMISKSVWDDGANKKVPKDFHNPSFGDPPCLDRSDGAPSNQPFPAPLVQDGRPPDLLPPHTEAKCRDFIDWVNQFHYQDCYVLEIQLDHKCQPQHEVADDPSSPVIMRCVDWRDRYTCTDAWVDGAPSEPVVTPPCIPEPDPEDEGEDGGGGEDGGEDGGEEPPAGEEGGEEPPADPGPEALRTVAPPAFGGHTLLPYEIPGPISPDTSPNATDGTKTECEGAECRCPAPPALTTPACVYADRGEGNGREYKSYFRKYMGVTYERAAVTPEAPQDQFQNDADVKCYGFYDEFNPRFKQTASQDKRCMIDIEVDDYPETQMGRGSIAVNGVSDPDPTQAGEQRNGGAYDEEEDIWYQKLGRSFSFINEKAFSSKYNRDLTSVYLDTDHLDRGLQKAIPQFSDSKPFGISNHIRAFDDTGENRTVVRWWQKQQTEAAALFHRPVIRMLLPSSWAYGIDMNDPLFRGSEPLPELDVKTARTREIEIQIQADQDLLGAVLAYLENSILLPVDETPVAVVVPLGSPTEFRAVAQEWCDWWIRKSGETNCDMAPEPVVLLMNRLEEYADSVENVRVLRTALAKYAGAVLQLQHDIVQPLSDWIAQNVNTFKSIVDEQKMIADEILPQWKSAQEQYLTFEGVTNLPWCMNQRYTPPVYSLLDTWLPGRVNNGSLYADAGGVTLPDLTGIEPRQMDAVLDLTSIRYLTGSLKLPVLKPTQVKLDLPHPPNINDEHGLTGDELPAFPDMGAIIASVQDSIDRLPDVATGDLPSQPPVPQPLGEDKMNRIRDTIGAISGVISGMDGIYDEFWDSLTMFDDGKRVFCADGGQELFPTECCAWDTNPCTHVEMDLLERLTRIGSRPLVELKEDYWSIGFDKQEGTVCLPGDHACDILNGEKKEQDVRWETLGNVSNQENVRTLRLDTRMLTLPEQVGGVSSANAMPYATDKKNLMPPYDAPVDIDLFAPQDSTSS